MNRRSNTPVVAAEQSLDATFQSVEKAIGADPNFLWMPCQGAYEDYRYSACYLDDNKNLFDSFRSLMSRLKAVGFQGAPSPTSDTELAAILTQRSPSTRLRVTYLGTVVEVVMERPGVGMVQSTDNSENAPAGMNTYVRKDARAMAKQVYYNLMIRGQLSLKRTEETVTPCEAVEASQGCFSAQSGITRPQFDEAFTNDYFAGNLTYFKTLNRQPTFTYNEEPLMERKVIDKPAILVQKQSDGMYIVRDSERYRGFEAVISYQEGGSPDLKVTVRALQEQP